LSARKPVALVLFVSDNSPRSIVAIANVRQALETAIGSNFALEIVDVFKDPHRALAARVLVTPTLLAPAAAQRLVGDLSDRPNLLYFLRGVQPAGGPSADESARSTG
jgi:circadian clock protein KaiB